MQCPPCNITCLYEIMIGNGLCGFPSALCPYRDCIKYDSYDMHMVVLWFVLMWLYYQFLSICGMLLSVFFSSSTINKTWTVCIFLRTCSKQNKFLALQTLSQNTFMCDIIGKQWLPWTNMTDFLDTHNRPHIHHITLAALMYHSDGFHFQILKIEPQWNNQAAMYS